MSIPFFVVVCTSMGINSSFANGANNNITIFLINMLSTIMTLLASVIKTKVLMAFAAFKWKKVFLMAQVKGTKLTNFFEFH